MNCYAVERIMKIQGVILRSIARKITLGRHQSSTGSMTRRSGMALAVQSGYDGLLDRRVGN
jgi:hypothetical protein